MVYPDSAMARRDPGLDKENLVPRAHKSEPGSGGLGSVRTREQRSNRLLSSERFAEQRLHTVLKESALQNQMPAAVTLSKTNMGSTEKDWLKNPSSDYSSGKHSSGSLERLKEKIGQLKSVGAMKSATQKSFEHHRPLDTSTLEHHSVGELHARSSTQNALIEDTKSNLDQDSQGKCPVAGESPQNVSPREQEVKSSRESSVEQPVEIIEIDSIKFEKYSSHGGAMRVHRGDPRYPWVTRGSDDHSPGSEKSADDDQKSPEAPHVSKMTDNHVNVQKIAPTILEAGTLSANESNQGMNQNSSVQTVEEYLNEHRKREADADPSITETSLLLSGVTGVTGLTALTLQQSVEIPHKTAVTSSHGVEVQQRSHNLQPSRERDRVTELPDRNGLSKSTARSTPAAEIPEHDVHEGHSAKSSDPPKDRGDKNQDIPPHNSQPPRKARTETENDKFVYVNGVRYQKLGKIGKGGSSEVFKVIAADCSIYALKRINLKGRDWSTAQEFYQEIEYLKALRGKRHIIQLVDSEVTNKKVLEKRLESGNITEEAFIYMVLEYGEIDLAGIIKREGMKSDNETKPNENWLRFYWQQILIAVRTIHDERIVHSDLKPANFMLVRGELKLIDFGIAKAIQNDTTNIVKENQTGTLNYMAPEALLQNQIDEAGLEIKIGRASDIWSLGCIFYQMVYGQTPFAELSFYSKIGAITNPHHRIKYPRLSNPWLLDIMKRCLTWDRRKRLRIPELLEHPFIQPHLAPYCSRCEQILQIGNAKLREVAGH